MMAAGWLTGCATRMSDAALAQQFVGTWSAVSPPGKVIENRPDGTFKVRSNGVETAHGKWQFKGGYVIADIGGRMVERNQVLRVYENQVIVLSMDGHTRLTFNRR